MATASEPNGYLRRNSMIGICIALLPTVGGLVAGYYNLVGELRELRLEQMNQRLAGQQSIDERSSLKKQTEENRVAVAGLKEGLSNEVTQRTEANREIETQFKALHDSTNVAIAELHRMNAIAWEKIPGAGTYPGGPYVFTNISNRK